MLKYAFVPLRLAMFLLTTASFSAHATLGGDSSSIETDRVGLGAQMPAVVSTTATHSVYQLILPGETIVRQFVSASGTVFAVVWSGPFKPDLRQILGPHFDTMLAHQADATHAGNPRNTVSEGNLVIESGGRMRDFFGRAYLQRELPVGVTPQNLK